MKKTVALAIFALLLITGYTVAYASGEEAMLYSYYGDNMLFRQNDDVVFAGTAESGTVITCALKNSSNVQIAYAETTAMTDGTFSLSFKAPSGGFEEYTVILMANNIVFEELSGIVFGELWLAGGQSNMALELKHSLTGRQMVAEGRTGSSSLRFLDISHTPAYKGDVNKGPALPLTDYEENVNWYKGSDAKVYDMSGVGYFFAEKLINELNMPVGIINANLGGTSILTWLSRAAIEDNAAVLTDCKNNNLYIPLDQWNENSVNFGLDMTSNYNKIIAPLKNFRLSGMIWYQGEGDLAWQYGRYTRAFNALQASYTEHFGYKDGLLPIVFTQLASYSYGNTALLPGMNSEFLDIQKQRPESLALTSIYDVPLDYTPDIHAIHPLRKKEVGEKMAHAAAGLVYGLNNSYTAAGPEKVEIKDGSIYITLQNTGDGLIVLGDTISGFSICGSDGVYVSAKAQLVSKNTVRVYSPQVPQPVSAAYAYTQTNYNSTLFASENGQKAFAVSPFVTDRSVSTHYWNNDFWATCDYEYFWHCHSNEYSGGYNTWNADGAAISFSRSETDTGNALYIKTNGNEKFSVSPNFLFKENGNDAYFHDVDLVWSDYDNITFKIKVKSGTPVRFDGLKIRVSNTLWVMPAVIGTNETGLTVDSDSETHTVTLDLNRLYPYGDVNATAYTAEILGVIWGAEFTFIDIYKIGAEICFDDVTFKSGITPDNNVPEPEKKPSFFDKVKAFFVSFFAKIALFFENLFK
ncbi:MAG: hypothetical protein IJN68_02010 [Clostridia bacterium]|nr:hypothetical protein [Clostridia bacterium]